MTCSTLQPHGNFIRLTQHRCPLTALLLLAWVCFAARRHRSVARTRDRDLIIPIALPTEIIIGDFEYIRLISWFFQQLMQNPGREGHYPCKMVIEKGKLSIVENFRIVMVHVHVQLPLTQWHFTCLWLAVGVRSSESCECKFPCCSSAARELKITVWQQKNEQLLIYMVKREKILGRTQLAAEAIFLPQQLALTQTKKMLLFLLVWNSQVAIINSIFTCMCATLDWTNSRNHFFFADIFKFLVFLSERHRFFVVQFVAFSGVFETEAASAGQLFIIGSLDVK